MVAERSLILVVDDDDDLREVLASELALALDLDVQMASDGESARALLLQHEFDLVLTDLRMPHGDGSELIEWIADQPSPRPKIILMTGFSETDLIRRARVDARLEKPFDLKRLFETVRRVLRDGAAPGLTNGA